MVRSFFFFTKIQRPFFISVKLSLSLEENAERINELQEQLQKQNLQHQMQHLQRLLVLELKQQLFLHQQ